jgi:hypothetical protein
MSCASYIFSAKTFLLLNERQVILPKIITTLVTSHSAGFLVKQYQLNLAASHYNDFHGLLQEASFPLSKTNL